MATIVHKQLIHTRIGKITFFVCRHHPEIKTLPSSFGTLSSICDTRATLIVTQKYTLLRDLISLNYVLINVL